MISKAMKCDRDNCGVVHMLTSDECAAITDEGAALGWIRLFINKPSKYSFRRDEQTSLEGWYDVCSISCAQDVLRSA
jgi:hypothetical protein